LLDGIDKAAVSPSVREGGGATPTPYPPNVVQQARARPPGATSHLK